MDCEKICLRPKQIETKSPSELQWFWTADAEVIKDPLFLLLFVPNKVIRETAL